MKVGVKKLQSLRPRVNLKLYDPTVINFDALPACDEQTDRQV